MFKICRKNKMNILIDASNILPNSGGYTHLNELLKNYKAKEKETIYVASSSKVVDMLKINKKKIKFISNFFLNKGIFLRLVWQFFFINSCLKKNKCSKLFVLGGYFFFIKNFKVILLIQNILPLEKKIFFEERLVLIIKNYLLNLLYRFSILRSDGIILLSKYSTKFLGKKKITSKLFLMAYKKIFLKNLKENKQLIKNLRFYMFQSMKNIKIN